MDNKETEGVLAEVTEKLDRLLITQQQTNTEIKKTRAAVKALCARLTHDQEREINTEIIPGSGLHKGDKVTIRNPNKGQEKRGTVIGKTRDNLIKLETPGKATIKRSPKNLERILNQE